MYAESCRYLLALACMACPSVVYAGGLFLYELGTPDLRLASAGWAARAEDPATVFTNPAGMTRLCGHQAQVNVQPIYAHIRFNPNSQTTVSGPPGNSSELIPAGSMFATTQLTDQWSAGVGALGYWGASLSYGNHWVGRYYVTKTLLQGFSLLPALAYRVNEWLSFGVGANLMYGLMDQQCAINNVLEGLGDGRLKIRDNRFAAGAILGALLECNPCTRVGVQYISRVSLKFKAKPNFQGLGSVLRDRLSLTGVLDSRVRITSKVPNSVMLSLYHQLNPCITVMANGGWQQWSTFARAEISLADSDERTLTVVPNYKDTWHGALGCQYALDSTLSLSAGVAFDSSMLHNRSRTLSLPVGPQWRFATGFEYLLCNGLVLNSGYEFIWSGDLDLDQRRGALTGRVAGDFHQVCQHILAVSLGWCF